MAKINMKGITFAALCAAKGKNEADYNVDAATTYFDKANVCLKRLMLIASGYNGDKKPDLADTNQLKYYWATWIEKDEDAPGGFRLSFLVYGYGLSHAFLGARPYFLNPDHVRESFEQWQNEIEAWQQNFNLYLLNEQ